MKATHRRGMETLRQALARLEQRGYDGAFLARPEGMLALAGDPELELEPEQLVLEETVRFEGESDPEDEAVLFALRTRDGGVRGTFVASYGSQMDPDSVAVVQRLGRVRPARAGAE